MQRQRYGLQLTSNSKVGWAFSLSRKKSCIGSTEACRKWCYGNGIRYGTDAQRAKRERNYRTAVLLLEKGGPRILAENLTMLIDQARPVDWVAAKVTGMETLLPWQLRLMDVGDAFSCDYTRAWQYAIEKRPECAFWFYTRSFTDNQMVADLTQLADLPNCQGWVSADSQNYLKALETYSFAPAVWKVALMQEAPEEMPSAVIKAIKSNVPADRVVNFPCHRSGHHVKPIDDFFVCPQVLGLYPLQTSSHVLKPCQQCAYCLP